MHPFPLPLLLLMTLLSPLTSALSVYSTTTLLTHTTTITFNGATITGWYEETQVVPVTPVETQLASTISVPEERVVTVTHTTVATSWTQAVVTELSTTSVTATVERKLEEGYSWRSWSA